MLGVLEADQARLLQRVDRDDLRAVALGLLERGQHPRVVGARVLPDDEDQLGLVDVLEADRALADADRLAEGRAGRLVAHVGAVGQVVGPEGADEQLVDERGLVGGLPGGVEGRLVGAVQPLEVPGHGGEGVVPRDRCVVGGAWAQHHRLGDAALLAQPELGAPGEVLHGVRGEELPVEQLTRRLLGDSLGAVLAELRRVPVPGCRVGPGATLAVEAVDLVEPGQRGCGAAQAHLSDGSSHRDRDGGQPGSGVRRRLDLHVALVDVVRGHLPGFVAQSGRHVSELGEESHSPIVPARSTPRHRPKGGPSRGGHPPLAGRSSGWTTVPPCGSRNLPTSSDPPRAA